MDDKLIGALRSLPRERAGVGFTAGVLRRLAEPRRAVSGGHRRWPMLATTAAVLMLAALGAREWWHLEERRQATARLAAMEQQREALEAELAELRRQVAGAQPVVYLGGSNDLDLVVDLARAKQAGVRPADIAQGLLRASRLGLPPQTSVFRTGRTPEGIPDGRTLGRPAGRAPVDPASAGIYPARPDDARTRKVY